MEEMTSRIGAGDGGAIAIDTKGGIAIGFNSARMSWAYAILNDKEEGGTMEVVEVHSGCNANEHFIEYLRLTDS